MVPKGKPPSMRIGAIYPRRLFSAIFVGLMLCLPAPSLADWQTIPPPGPKGAETARKTLESAFRQAQDGGNPVHIDVDLEFKEESTRAQKGDLVQVHFTAWDEDGKVARTTRREIAMDKAVAKADGYQDRREWGPEPVVGGAGTVPLFLGEVILGMEAGQRKRANIPPEKAFGVSDPAKKLDFPCARTMPRKVRLSAHEYTSRYKTFPQLGREVDWVPYFKARTVEVTDADVGLELLARDGERVEEELGAAEIKVAGEMATITLTPRLGASFTLKDRQGRIVSTDGRSFTVDFNPPLAGRSVVLDVEVVSIVKASSLKDKELSWTEDHDEGLARGRSQGKPAVLVLYADWCGYCKKLFEETFADPRIKALRDDYIWVRVNSDREKQYHELYQQNGFPLVILFDRQGGIARKIDGFRDASALRKELAALGSAI
jgi:FKBP-type peptidyl-prolyl cis-trans isomerase 2